VTTCTSGRAWSTIGAGAVGVGAIVAGAAGMSGAAAPSTGATVGVAATAGSGMIVGSGARGIEVSTAGVLVVDDEAAWATPITAMSPNIVVAPSPAAMIRPPAAGWRRRDPVVWAVARAGLAAAVRVVSTTGGSGGPDGGGSGRPRSGSMSVIVVGALVLR